MHETIQKRGITNKKKAPVSGKSLLECPNLVCWFMIPQRLSKQITDWSEG